MPECEAFPETAGRYELEECETDRRGNAVRASYVTMEDGQLFYMDAVDVSHGFAVGSPPDWHLDCHVIDREANDSWDCEFGSASYESFDDDEITSEIVSLGQSVDDDILNEMREDRIRHRV